MRVDNDKRGSICANSLAGFRNIQLVIEEGGELFFPARPLFL